MYIAAVLDAKSVSKIKEAIQADWKLSRKMDFHEEFPDFIYQTEAGMELPHHMTINLVALNKSLNDPKIIGKPVRLICNTVYVNSWMGVCAISVDKAYVELEIGKPWVELNTSNNFPHITVCLKKGATPKTSNNMLESKFDDNTKHLKLVYDLHLDAIVEEIK